MPTCRPKVHCVVEGCHVPNPLVFSGEQTKSPAVNVSEASIVTVAVPPIAIAMMPLFAVVGVPRATPTTLGGFK
jgi:hypothetical protein